MREPLLALLFMLSAVVASVVALVGWRRRHVTPAVGTLAVVATGIAVWSVTGWLGFLVGDPGVLVWLGAVGLLSVGAVMAGFHCLSLAVVDRAWRLSRRTALWLSAEPALVLAAFLVAPWRQRFITLVAAPGESALLLEFGPLFWMHTAYSYILLTFCMARLVRAWIRGPRTQRRLYGITLLAATPSTLVNVASLAGLTGEADMTPIGFCVTTVLSYWALVRLSLHELVPVERRHVLDRISDLVMTIDPSGRILDLNPAAERMLRQLAPGLPERITGLPVLGVLADVPLTDTETAPALSGAEDGDPPFLTVAERRDTVPAKLFPRGLDAPLDLVDRLETDYTVVDARGRGVDLNVRVSALVDSRGERVGWAFVGRDVTALNAQRWALREANARLQEQVATIEALRADLAEQAVRDALTGLHNRRFLMEALGREMRAAGVSGGSLSVALLDIDHFKQINDRYGHGAGDQVLMRFAKLVGGRVRAGDVVARYGGEEFVIVFPGASGEQAVERVEAIRVWVAAGRVPAGGHTLSVSFSAGVAGWCSGMDAGEVLHAADEALYAAKRAGRNRVVLAGGAGAVVSGDAVPGTGAGTGGDAVPGTDAGAVPGTGAGGDVVPGTGAGAVPGTGAGGDVVPGTGAGAVPGTGTGTGGDAVPGGSVEAGKRTAPGQSSPMGGETPAAA
ncbi:diguanylate cyclase [Planomonospora sp. ID82291]|uniref:histidine kinase N-terminal 7TM domain-containing diguanylate cyclase n=1 Tax=Planomonospora sp. ID82291 TaxID=2738136 RepID=UPI0018C35C76|nr:diguanylate cyclase [Planomonospora sp. ID82291]MBG0818551.1 diguanylate cyclase [Planomonospora sp. ID82291]